MWWKKQHYYFVAVNERRYWELFRKVWCYQLSLNSLAVQIRFCILISFTSIPAKEVGRRVLKQPAVVLNMSMATTSGTTPLEFEVGSALFYVVVGAGSIMSILLCVILILCVAIGCLVARKRRSYTVTPTPPQPGEQSHNEEGHTPSQQQQLQSQPQGNDTNYAHTQ